MGKKYKLVDGVCLRIKKKVPDIDPFGLEMARRYVKVALEHMHRGDDFGAHLNFRFAKEELEQWHYFGYEEIKC